jgi:hypothetical protein
MIVPKPVTAVRLNELLGQLPNIYASEVKARTFEHIGFTSPKIHRDSRSRGSVDGGCARVTERVFSWFYSECFRNVSQDMPVNDFEVGHHFMILKCDRRVLFGGI